MFGNSLAATSGVLTNSTPVQVDLAANTATLTVYVRPAAGDQELSAEDQSKFDALMDEIDTLQASIKREHALIEADRDALALAAAVRARSRTS